MSAPNSYADKFKRASIARHIAWAEVQRAHRDGVDPTKATKAHDYAVDVWESVRQGRS